MEIYLPCILWHWTSLVNISDILSILSILSRCSHVGLKLKIKIHNHPWSSSHLPVELKTQEVYVEMEIYLSGIHITRVVHRGDGQQFYHCFPSSINPRFPQIHCDSSWIPIDIVSEPHRWTTPDESTVLGLGTASYMAMVLHLNVKQKQKHIGMATQHRYGHEDRIARQSVGTLNRPNRIYDEDRWNVPTSCWQ